MVCRKVALGVTTAPSFLQVTLVAGPPVEVQVRLLDWPLKVRVVKLGIPVWTYKKRWW